MPTKYLVILFIIVAIGGGLYFFQKNRKNEAIKTHNIQQLQRMTKVAKKSSVAGLSTMAEAINKYHGKNGHYPKDLLKLYPEFIPEKSFISQVKWTYRPEKKSYILQKSVGKGQVLASIGPDLKLEIGSATSLTPINMVASVDKPTALQKTKTPQKSVKKAGVRKAPQAETDTKDNTETNQLAKISLQNPIKTLGDINSGEEREPYKSNLLISTVKKELDKDEEFLRSFDGDDFYIWKSKDGTIGFSNMQYPDEKKLAVYRDQNWIEYIEK